MKVVSFFSGCGGLDLGFEQAGFDVIWANDINPIVYDTYTYNHPNTYLCKKDMRELAMSEIPECDGFIGGPPCQSWSEGGKQLGLLDERGKLFLTYINIIRSKQPKFFVIENVKGILSDKHFQTFMAMLEDLQSAGYYVHYSLLNSMFFHIPQERYRVIIVGIRKDLKIDYHFPKPDKTHIINLRQAIGDITEEPNAYKHERVNKNYLRWLNHDVYVGPFDSKFMARNRVRNWNEVSFTIQAQARNCPLHPQAPKMKFISRDKQIFTPGYEHLYRRFSVRECARIQTFPDHFRFIYNNVCDGYTMVGNAVPPRLGRVIASSIAEAFSQITNSKKQILVATYKDNYQLNIIKEQHIYYVRAGLRFGSIQFPTGKKGPDYLLLHKNDKRMLFRLKCECPQIVTADKLRDYGFLPSGDLYWLLKTEEELSQNELKTTKLKLRTGKLQYVPYILEVDSI
nr:DNA cytosine methyltransferase [uncultured Prevotella sp.]